MQSTVDFLEQSPTGPHWKKVGIKQHHGVCVPLFTLRTDREGIGDFSHLYALIDWCKKIGFSCIQLLPLNDTGNDPSPYNLMSACALDPVYIHVPELTTTTEWSRAEIKAAKIEYLRKRFMLIDPKEYKQFFSSNSWLSFYVHDDFSLFVQWVAFQQLKTVKEYADQKNILLIGDIPILVSPQSVDVATHPNLFDVERTAGAPPDAYNRLGQGWGFPIYQWEEMRRTGFSWWKERLAVASQFFHAYRIDHVVGFFRIWTIPKGAQPKEGYYIPQDQKLWEAQGKEILQMMIEATMMLPLAEDLGTIPEIVPQVLRELGICGTKVLRWQKRAPSEYDPISMTTVSTADSEPLQLWWRNHPEEAREVARRKGWRYEPFLEVWQRREILRDSHQSTSLFHINLLQEYLALFPELVSINPEEERINVPGTINPKNWSYRCKPTLEEIITHRDLAQEIQRMIQ